VSSTEKVPGGGQSSERRSDACGVLLLQSLPPRWAVHNVLSGFRPGGPCPWRVRQQMLKAIEARAASLKRSLPGGWRTFHAVHGSRPGVRAALEQAVDQGVRRLIVIPMHPQFSDALGGRALRALYNALRGRCAGLHVEVRASYSEDSGYIEAVAREVLGCALASPCSPATPASHELVFAPGAHANWVRDDETFRAQLARTAELVALRLGWPADRWHVADGEADGCLENGHAIVCRLGALPVPEGEGDDEYTKALVGLVRRGVHQAEPARLGAEPLLRSSWRGLVERDIDDLVMIGVSIPGALGERAGTRLRHCSHDEYRLLKRPHMEVVELLTSLRQREIFRECFVWNTCNRFELYGWMSRDDRDRQALLRQTAAELLGSGGEPHMNILHGRSAWRHLLATAAGLNSALGGDGEVSDQLEAAVRTAHHAGSAGPRSDALAADAQEAVREVRSGTAWGRFDHRYCWVALERLCCELQPVLAAGRVLVLGGSTTSCSVLEALSTRFAVPRQRMTLVYRGQRNGRLAKRLHSAVGEGQALSVEVYDDPAVLQAVSQADVLFLATDQREPVLHGRAVAGVRDTAARPLTVVDFNTFSSTEGVRELPGVRLIDAEEVDRRMQAFNVEILDDSRFLRAAAEAQRWIDQRVGVLKDESGPGGGERKSRRRPAVVQPAGVVA
jgi:glutamyl-tRNA reductase